MDSPMTVPHIAPLPHQPVSPNFNHQAPPDANPHMNPSPAGGQVFPDQKWLGQNLARERGIEKRERAERLANS
jgi:hypothetical protein